MQVPKYVRWHYKLETNQILEVSIKFHNNFHFAEIFLSRISKDGRIVIPKLTIELFKDGKPNLDNNVAFCKRHVPSAEGKNKGCFSCC